MEFLRLAVASTDSIYITDLPVTLRHREVEVIVLPAQSEIPERDCGVDISFLDKRPIGFVDGPPLPDSFFDPLPEEDLQAWGL